MRAKNYVLFICINLFITAAFAQLPQPNFPETNERVLTIVTQGDTTYLGGGFTRVFSNDSSSRFGAFVLPGTGSVNGKWPRPNGVVGCVIPDGQNGFYIGGHFSQVGDQPRKHIAHIDSNGVLTSRFSNSGVNGYVFSMVVNNNTLYCGGNFTTAGPGIVNTNQLVTDTAGNIRQTFPEVNGFINCVLEDGIGGWFIGGTFTMVGAACRPYLAHMDSIGHVYEWNPAPDGVVNSMARYGDTLFITGDFTFAGGKSSNTLMGIRISTGNAISWNPQASGAYLKLTTVGTTLYVYGTLSSAGGQVRKSIAAFDLVTGNVLPWDPNPGTINSVQCMAVSGNIVFIGGSFGNIGGQNRASLAAVDKTTGLATSWNPASSLSPSVYSLAVAGNTLYVVGRFSSMGGQTRNNAAAFDITTGNVTNWNPNTSTSIPTATGRVENVVVAGNGIVITGEFTSAGGQIRNYAAMVDASTGNALPWNLNPNEFTQIAVAGNLIYSGGRFTAVKGELRNYMAALDITTGNVTGWNPSANFFVNTLMQNAGIIYAGGSFTTIGGQTRNYLAAITSGNSSTLLPWNPNPNGGILALCAHQGNIYVSGNFSTIGGQSRVALAALNAFTGAPTAWSPSISGDINTMALSSSRLYIGGVFTVVNNQPRRNAASFDLSTGNLNVWNPNMDKRVRCIMYGKNTVYLAGEFTNVNSAFVGRTYLAEVDDTSGNLTSWNPYASSWCRSIALSDYGLYAAGEFTLAGGVLRNRLAAVDNLGNILPWNPGANNLVYSLLVKDKIIYVGGLFSSIGGQARNRIAAIDRTNGNVTPWNPNIGSGPVLGMQLRDNLLYVCGSFSSVGGNTRNYLAAVDTASGNASSWSPNANNTVNALTIAGNKLYCGGLFTNIGGQTRNRAAAFDLGSGNLMPWSPNIGFGPVTSMAVIDSNVYLGGLFGSPYVGLLITDTTLGIVNNWNFQVDTSTMLGNSEVNCIVPAGPTIYVGGGFKYMDGKSIPHIAAIDKLTRKVTNWRPVMNGDVMTIQPTSNTVYIGGYFTAPSSSGALFSRFPNRNYSAAYVRNDLSLQTLNPSTTAACPGASLSIPFTVSLPMGSGNIFQAQLSDANGSFVSPRTIGSISTNVSDTISAVIPMGIPAGNYYRLRILSSFPQITSQDIGPFSVHPTVRTDFTINTVNQCLSGNNFIFSDSSYIANGSYTRLWKMGGQGNDTSSLATPQRSYVNVGTYTIMLTTTSNMGCKDSVSKTVTVSAMPKAGFTINQTEQCLYANHFQYTDTSLMASQFAQRLWSFGTPPSDTSTKITSEKSYTSAGTYTVQLKVKNTNGCSDSIIRTTLVYPQTTVAFSVNDSDQCKSGNFFTFSNNSAVSAGTISNDWVFGDNDTSNQISPSHIYNTIGSYLVKLVTTTNYGCKDSLIIGVVVHPNPIASFTTDSAQCLTGNQFVMNNGSSGSPTSYHWNFGNTTTSVNTNPSVSFASAGNYNIRLVAQNSFGCNDTVVKNVRVKQNPAIPLFTYSPDTVVCDNINIVLKTGDTNTRSWMKNGAHLGITTDSLVVTNSPGSYSLKVTNTENCDAISTVANLFFKPTPVKPIVTVSGNTLTSSSTTGNQWYKSSGIISGETGQTYSASSVGQYYTIVTLNGCPSPASDMANFPATGNNTPVFENGISVYPNPNDGTFTINFSVLPATENVDMSIMDMTGRLVKMESLPVSKSISVSLGQISSGTYLIILRIDKAKYMRIPLIVRKK